MATGLLPNLESKAAAETELPSLPADPTPLPVEPPAYLARIATLPASLPDHEANSPDSIESDVSARPEAARIDQIEHALTILASVVARLAKAAQQSRLQLRITEHDPSAQEDRRVQRELVRSMQARLSLMEERLERENAERMRWQSPPEVAPDVDAQLAVSLHSIRDSLALLARKRSATSAGSE